MESRSGFSPFLFTACFVFSLDQRRSRGGSYDGSDFHAFVADNRDLDRVKIPVISFFGAKDEATPASFILPAMKYLSGPTCVIELVDQPP